jgi:four helix bundle protein
MKATTKGDALMNFDALKIALELIRALRTVVERLREKDPKLATQLTTAASSIAANLAEGRRRMGRDRSHLFRIAAGSTDEVKTHLMVAVAWGWVGEDHVAPALQYLDRLLAITWRLTH